MALGVMEQPAIGSGSGRVSAIPPEGKLEGTSIPEVFCALSQEGFSGALMLERRGVRKVIYFRDGRVVFAASSDPEDRLGTFLLRRGEVRLAPLLEASGAVARGRRLGQILVENGVMDPGAVVRAVLDQVREVALSVFAWREGGYKLSRVALPAQESITLDLPTETLVLAGIKRVRDWRWVRRAVGGPRAVYRRAEMEENSAAGFGMTERAILDQLARPCRVESLCREVYAASYDIYRSLWALSIIGAVQREDPRTSALPASMNEGFLPAGGAIELLIDLASRRYTGVVRLFHDGSEGALFLHEGRVQFVTSSDPERSLLAHLLRRGVISDLDHEDALRRLLTGKRVGTILAERGALQPDDVERFVREQLLEVGRNLLLWHDGEYTLEEAREFQEEIKLDISVEDLVVEACASIEKFDTVWAEIGGLSALYRLRRDYLDRLDRMTLRPTVWELVSLLSKERTLEELLAARPEPDFELSRLMLALSRVGVIERVEDEEILRRARESREALGSSELISPPEPEAEPPLATPLQAHSATEIAPELFPAGQAASTPQFPEPEQERERAEAVASNPDDEWFRAPIPAEEPDTPLPAQAAGAELEAAVDPLDRTLEMEREELEALQRDDSRPRYERPSIIGATGQGTEAEPGCAITPSESTELPLVPSPAAVEQAIGAIFGDESGSSGESSSSSVSEGSSEQISAPSVNDRAASSIADEVSVAEAQLQPGSTLEIPREEVARLLASEEREQTGPIAAAGPTEAADSELPPASDSAAGLDSVALDEAPAADHEPAETPQEAAALESAAPQFELDIPAQAPPPEPLPAELLAEIERFNRRHQLVFQEIRLEIGAGARNFVMTCLRRLGAYAAPYEGLGPDKSGAFDVESLGRSLERHPQLSPREVLEGLIEMEVGLVADLLAPSRRLALQEALRQER